MTPTTEAFAAHLRAMPDWAPEFEVHRPWVEKLLLDAWDAATERAAKECEERAAAYRSTNAPGWHSVDHECTQCAAAIRASSGKGDCDV